MIYRTGEMRALGTSIRWASVLKDGCSVPTHPRIAHFLGWSVNDEVVDVPVKGASTHFASRIRETVERLGLLRDSPWERFKRTRSNGPKIIFCTTSSNPLKDWEGSKWDLLNERLFHRGLEIEYQTEKSLLELECQFSEASLIVGVDSGPLHLADYMDIKTLGLFGFTSPEVHGTLHQKSRMINRHRGVKGIEVDLVERIILELLDDKTPTERVTNV